MEMKQRPSSQSESVTFQCKEAAFLWWVSSSDPKMDGTDAEPQSGSVSSCLASSLFVLNRGN